MIILVVGAALSAFARTLGQAVLVGLLVGAFAAWTLVGMSAEQQLARPSNVMIASEVIVGALSGLLGHGLRNLVLIAKRRGNAPETEAAPQNPIQREEGAPADPKRILANVGLVMAGGAIGAMAGFTIEEFDRFTRWVELPRRRTGIAFNVSLTIGLVSAFAWVIIAERFRR